MIGSSLMLGLESESLSKKERSVFTKQKVAGVILFKRNLKNFKQIHRLCQDIKSLSLDHQGEAPLIAIDMEGGSVNRLAHIKESLPWPSAQELSQKPSNEIFEIAQILGERLRLLGFDINFAPVVDLPVLESPLLKGRTFGNSPEFIIEKASAFMKGLQAGGVIPCLKHFPGHGSVLEDSHKVLPKDFRLLKDLEPQLRIFETLFQHNPVCVMTAHIEFPNIEKTPASFSQILLQEELKKKRGFSGLLVSDDIDMAALDSFSPGERVARSLRGGCHLILICQKEETYMEVFRYFENHPEIQKELEPLIKLSCQKISDLKKEQKKIPSLSWEDVFQKLSSKKY